MGTCSFWVARSMQMKHEIMNDSSLLMGLAAFDGD